MTETLRTVASGRTFVYREPPNTGSLDRESLMKDHLAHDGALSLDARKRLMLVDDPPSARPLHRFATGATGAGWPL